MLGSIWTDIGEIAFIVVLVLFVVGGVGLALAYNGMLVVVALVYPFKYVRRFVRVYKQTQREFDSDGHRKVSDKTLIGFHYGSVRCPIYPLDGYDWPQRHDPFSNEPLWCVTRSYDGQRCWFCKRNGRPFKRLPRRLRGLDAQQAFRDRQRAATREPLAEALA